MVSPEFWKGKKVFLTGHTGFKGAWLSIWLRHMGAEVTGYALSPPTAPSLFELAGLSNNMKSIIGDIRDRATLQDALLSSKAEIVIHMAAQPLVRHSYKDPIGTYETNVMGTLYLLDVVRSAIADGQCIKSVLNVTTDKCYENKEWDWGYRENEPLGGYDPYSSSKACSELVTASYRSSYFHPERYAEHGVAIATARAGNVIGGGDWAEDRLIPDCIRALSAEEPVTIRNPRAIRPWQHVLEPLSGYLMLSERLYRNGGEYAEAWNFGPNDADAKPVDWIVQRMCALWGETASFQLTDMQQPHEAAYLKLDISKAKNRLGWRPAWTLDTALDRIIDWSHGYLEGKDIRTLCERQIEQYMNEGQQTLAVKNRTSTVKHKLWP